VLLVMMTTTAMVTSRILGPYGLPIEKKFLSEEVVAPTVAVT
jgi:hypothetical protein